jgi:hypothetical protein
MWIYMWILDSTQQRSLHAHGMAYLGVILAYHLNPTVDERNPAPVGNYWQLVTIKHCKERDYNGINMHKPSTNWCRISQPPTLWIRCKTALRRQNFNFIKQMNQNEGYTIGIFHCLVWLCTDCVDCQRGSPSIGLFSITTAEASTCWVLCR